jgi:hypothetical protein
MDSRIRSKACPSTHPGKAVVATLSMALNSRADKRAMMMVVNRRMRAVVIRRMRAGTTVMAMGRVTVASWLQPNILSLISLEVIRNIPIIMPMAITKRKVAR